VNFIFVLYNAAKLWIDKGANYYAAAFSYYAPLAIVPLLFFSVAVATFFYGGSFANQVFADWGDALGSELVEVIRVAVDNLSQQASSSRVPIVGGLFFLGFYIIALNVISDGFERLWGRETSGFVSFLIKSARALVFLFVLQIYLVFVIGMEFFIMPAVFGSNSYISSAFLFLSSAIFFTALFRFLVVKSPSLKGCIAGGVVSSVLFVAIKSMVDLYVATTPVLSFYGAAGLILVLFVWVYVLAALIYYGAAVAGLYGRVSE
jgi:membrane protein